MLDFRRNTQNIFQDPYAYLNPRILVKTLIATGIHITTLAKDRADRHTQVTALLEQVGLNADTATRYPTTFSGGQRQNFGIARALAVQPLLLIADTPISALDVSIQAQVVNLLKTLQDRQGHTYLLLATHLSMVKYISHRIAVNTYGRLVTLASATTVYTTPLTHYTKSLLSAIPVPDPTLTRQRVPIP